MISTHILDTTKGQPAQGVRVTLEIRQDANWLHLSQETTNNDGRIIFNCPYQAGDYRLTFFIEDYFQAEEHFFLNTPVLFRIKNTQRKYHVPLIINPYGLSTYRGS
jgi:5-hydroxyisourate hydrolase